MALDVSHGIILETINSLLHHLIVFLNDISVLNTRLVKLFCFFHWRLFYHVTQVQLFLFKLQATPVIIMVNCTQL